MKNKLIKRVLALALICCVCLSAFGCEEASSDEPIWKDKWNSVIVERTEDIKVASLCYCNLFSSSIMDYAPAYFTDKGDIDNIVGMLKELDFEAIAYEDLPGRSLFSGCSIIVNLIIDTQELDWENGEKRYNETGTTYKNAFNFHIRTDGYVYIVYNPDAPEYGNDEQKMYFKSTTKVSYDAFYKLHEDNKKMYTMEEYKEIFGNYPNGYDPEKYN